MIFNPPLVVNVKCRRCQQNRNYRLESSEVTSSLFYSYKCEVCGLPQKFTKQLAEQRAVDLPEYDFPEQRPGFFPIRGYCPMGCGETLRVQAPGVVVCGNDDCPYPSAVHKILANSETEHLVNVDQAGFSMKHPLRERVEDGLFYCPVYKYVKRVGYTMSSGSYRVKPDPEIEGGYLWESLS